MRVAGSCVECGSPFEGHPKRLCCSPACVAVRDLRVGRERAARNRARDIETHRARDNERTRRKSVAVRAARPHRPCPFCGEHMDNLKRVQCGATDCRLARNAERMRSIVQARRAQQITGRSGERFEPVDIFERDAWACHICGEPIDRLARPRSSRSPSLDHVVPLSKGGMHSPESVRCAHFGCNAAKGSKTT